MRIPNVALAEEAGRRVVDTDRTTFQVVTEPGGKPIEMISIQERIEFLVAHDHLAYGTSRRKPAERCAVMGDGIEVVRGVVVE